MKVYEIYTDKRSHRLFTNNLLVSVLVIAETEEEAFTMVKKEHKNSFTCSDDELKIKVFSEIENTPIIVHCDYNEY